MPPPDIREKIRSLEGDAQLVSQTATLLEQLKSLEKSFNQAAIYIPPYDQKTYLQVSATRKSRWINGGWKGMRTLMDELQVKQKTLKPKGKFSFSSRSAKAKEASTTTDTSTTPPPSTTTTTTLPEKVTQKVTHSALYASTIRGLRNTVYRLTREDSTSTSNATGMALDTLVDECTRCIIDLTSDTVDIAALHLNNLTECLVIAKPLQGSALMENCHRCIFALPCHQV